MTEYVLDARHTLCPMPVIKTQTQVYKLAHGDKLTVLATDPGAKHDLAAWCRIHGHKLLAIEDLNNEIHLSLEVVKDE